MRILLQKGQSLIEIIVAIGIVALVMTALVSAISLSVKNTAEAKAKAVATKYSQEGMEFLIEQRNALGWEAFLAALQTDAGATTTVTYCLPTPLPTTISGFVALGNGSCTSTQFADSRGIFQRKAVITLPAGGTQINITVSVTWSDGNLNRTSQVLEILRKNLN
jgi:type II secretory pathway pseudopilin PulG